MRAGVLGGQKRVGSCAATVVVSYPTGVLGTELGSSTRTVHALKL